MIELTDKMKSIALRWLTSHLTQGSGALVEDMIREILAEIDPIPDNVYAFVDCDGYAWSRIEGMTWERYNGGQRFDIVTAIKRYGPVTW